MKESFAENFTTELDTKGTPKKRNFGFAGYSFSFFVFLCFGSYLVFQNLLQPPRNFPLEQKLMIEPGSSFQLVAEELEKKDYIKSSSIMLLRQYFRSQPLVIKAGNYNFSSSLTLPQLEEQLEVGDYSNNLIVLTHREGEAVVDLAKSASQILDNFDSQKFTDLAKLHEGKLFPDTYHLPKDYTEEELLNFLLQSFTEKIAPLDTLIASSSLTLDEIIILASIIEREANDETSMKMVSSILQNRLTINMPLQVDASMEYVLNKPLKELTADDLKVDSPYNTYLNVGLPPTPIGNPGLLAIKAVLEPADSDYLFYITGTDGKFYYARNFESHKMNIARYLR